MLGISITTILRRLALNGRGTAAADIDRGAAFASELSGAIVHAAIAEPADVLARLETDERGLDAERARAIRAQVGDNVVTHVSERSLARRLAAAFVNPFTGILAVLAAVSLYADVIVRPAGDRDPLTVVIIGAMLLISGALRFTQESRSGSAAESLTRLITNTCTVVRAGEACEVPFEELVPGDMIRLGAGDLVPADARIVRARDLFVNESALTGESAPVEKHPDAVAPAARPLAIADCANIVFTGTSVESGGATAVVVATGNATYLGGMARVLDARPPQTSFDKGVADVSRVLVAFMLVMVPIVFVVNIVTKQDWTDALLFSASVAVGITPQMLPVIVTTCLAKGATAMARERTVVKNLSAIQNLGAMDVLCCDKTGTLTADRVVLERHYDAAGRTDDAVLALAYLNSRFQTGVRNLIDRAITERADELAAAGAAALAGLAERYEKVDEVPFDFERRRLSVVVRKRGGAAVMVTKGAVEEMLAICSEVELDGCRQPLTRALRTELSARVTELNEAGLRVIAVARKDDPRPAGELSVADERDLVLVGYLTFLDPPKASAADAVRALHGHGVDVKVLTGDSDRVAAAVCGRVGIEVGEVLLGSDIEGLSDAELAARAEVAHLFAKLSPLQKARVVRVLREAGGHTVGFMGDGVNDAAAMRASDCGISVDTAVDIAKESADVILLDKDLGVLERGIVEGRRTYGNMIKYIKMTASSNFGNVFSMLAASAFLPFLPMTALQLVLLSLLYEISCAAIPWDRVDAEFLARPRPWQAGDIARFMVWFGPASSLFDLVAYAALYFAICPAAVGCGWGAAVAAGGELGEPAQLFAAVFQSGWFVVSMWTQTLVIWALRTSKLPFVQSRPSAALAAVTALGIAAVTALPFTPFADALGLADLPAAFFILLAATVVGYLLVVSAVKAAYVRRYGGLL